VIAQGTVRLANHRANWASFSIASDGGRLQYGRAWWVPLPEAGQTAVLLCRTPSLPPQAADNERQRLEPLWQAVAATLSTATPATSLVWLLAAMIVTGVGLGICMVGTLMNVQNALERRDTGAGTGALLVLRGYSVMLCNYRGSTGYGQALVDSLCGKVGRQDVDDMVLAVEQVLPKPKP
jgi:hypothetical protein